MPSVFSLTDIKFLKDIKKILLVLFHENLESSWKLGDMLVTMPDMVVILSDMVVILSVMVILQKLYTEYELQGMEAEKLNTNFYVQVSQRMATEEATCVLSNADQADTG